MRYLAGLVAVTCALVFTSTGLAADVNVTSAEAQGDNAVVHGVVDFPTPGRESVTTGLTPTAGPAAATPAGDAAGLKLTDAQIVSVIGGLRFIWKVDGMPAQVPPEGVRYTWGFQIGNTVYQLQAKRTNLVSLTTAEDPIGHIQHLPNDYFQLRGACQASYQGTPVAGCYHLAFLQGGFLPDFGEIWVDLPYQPKDPLGRIVAPDFKPGATLVDNAGVGTANMTISAAFQAGVSNTDLARYFNDVAPYYAGLRVDLGLEGAQGEGEDFAYSTTVVPNDDGTFTAVVPGLAASTRKLRARACNGVKCVAKTVTIS